MRRSTTFYWRLGAVTRLRLIRPVTASGRQHHSCRSDVVFAVESKGAVTCHTVQATAG